MRLRVLATAVTVVAATLVALGCAHATAYDPYLATLDIQAAANEAANDTGLNLYFGYECEIDGDPHDDSRFTVNCQTTTGDGRITTMTGHGQSDSSRHYHGTFVIKVDDKAVATRHCLGSQEAPRC